MKVLRLILLVASALAAVSATGHVTCEYGTPAPTTLEPATPEPTTAEPATPEPTTPEPTTSEPATLAPTTLAPATPEPTTSEPTTPPEPATSEPSTPDPTTLEPDTPEPTTTKPATPEPTTAEPATPEPTPEPTMPVPETPLPTTPTPAVPQCDAPISGKYYKHFDLKIIHDSSIAQCCAACQTTAGCVAYSFKTANNVNANKCVLKWKKGELKSGISYKSASMADPNPPLCKYNSDFGYTGQQLLVVDDTDVDGCCQACRAHADCKGFNMVSEDKCRLLKKVTGQSNNIDASGYALV